MTVAELDQRLGSSEFSEWMAYYKLEPFGTERDNYHAAMVAALLANIHRKKGTEPVEAEAFMLRDPEEKRQREIRRMMAMFDSLAKVNHGS